MLEDEMLTIEDLAAYLKLKPQTIYKWAQTGKIPGAKFGKEWRFRRSTIEQWIDDSFPPRFKTSPSKGEDHPEEAPRAGDENSHREARSTALAEGGNSASANAEGAPAATRRKSIAKRASARKKAHGPGEN